MPRPLVHDVESARESNNALEVLRAIRVEKRRGMRDITRKVQRSVVIVGDKQRNAVAKQKKPTDRISKHVPNRAYVLSDMTVTDWNGNVLAVKRTNSRIVAATRGDDNLTLAVASLINTKRGTR